MNDSVQNNGKIGARDGLPIGLGYLAISFAFGILATSVGLSIPEAVLISMTNLTSAGQLAALPIIAAGGSYFELALTQLVINIRYSLMSISLSQRFDSKIKAWDRLYLAFALTDEIFAVSCGKEQNLGRRYLIFAILPAYAGWTLGTLFGAIAGNILPQILINALGTAMYAMFIAIVVPVSKRNKPVALCVLTALVLSCVFYYTPYLNKIPSGFVIIIVAVLVGALFALLFPIDKFEGESKPATYESEGDGAPDIYESESEMAPTKHESEGDGNE